MTTPIPTATQSASEDDPRRLLASYVGRRVSSLQHTYLAKGSSAIASLARLRRAVNREPGSDPAVWQETFDQFPGPLIGKGDAPSSYEWAAHAAITLYAVHQQSKQQEMHQGKIGIGRAARRLGEQTGSAEAVLRRFQSLGTASTFSETVYHARSLITQLRAQSIALDYGILAADLVDIQNPYRADGVRLRWGRDYYRVESTLTRSTEQTSNITSNAADPSAANL